MKNLLTALSVLAIATTTGNLGNSLNTSISTNNNINENDDKITERIDYKWSDSYGPYFSIYSSGDGIYVFRWKSYAFNWSEFVNRYQSFAFDNSSFLTVTTGDNSNSADLSKPLDTSLIKGYDENTNLNIIYSVQASTLFSQINASLIIFHDYEYIYFQWIENNGIFSFWPFSIPTTFDLNLNIIKFWTSYSIK